jgi:dTDP-4-amino-4,6-dideoxygalactose transaminase
MNGRLDTLQAAVLLEKLSIFESEIAARQRVARQYDAGLADKARCPGVIAGANSVWAQYTLVVDDRAGVAAACKAATIPTAIYYPIPLSKQTGYRHFPTAPGGVPVSENLSRKVISLPMHPYLSEAAQDRIVSTVRAALG